MSLPRVRGSDPNPAIPRMLYWRLEGRSQGLIALTGGPDGPLDRPSPMTRAELAFGRAALLRAVISGEAYVKSSATVWSKSRAIEPRLFDLAYRASLPLIATNEVFFAGTPDYEAHDALNLYCGGNSMSATVPAAASPEHRFKTRAQMLTLFADVPEATSNSVEIALRCCYRPLSRKPILRASPMAASRTRPRSFATRRRLALRRGLPFMDRHKASQRLIITPGSPSKLDVIIKMNSRAIF